MFAYRQAYRYEKLIGQCEKDFEDVKEIQVVSFYALGLRVQVQIAYQDKIHHTRKNGQAYIFDHATHKYVQYLAADID